MPLGREGDAFRSAVLQPAPGAVVRIIGRDAVGVIEHVADAATWEGAMDPGRAVTVRAPAGLVHTTAGQLVPAEWPRYG
jgi:hypothetical protein